MVTNLLASTKHNDKKEVKWYNDILRLTYEELADPGEPRFHPLCRMMSAGVKKTLPRDLARKVQKHEQEALKLDTTLAGRQIVWLLIDYFRTDDHMATIYGYNDLHNITWFGDDKIGEFEYYFDYVVDNLEDRAAITDNMLRDVLKDKIANSVVLQHDFAHFKRVGRQHADHSYEFLRAMMTRYQTVQHQERMLDNKNNELRRMGKGKGQPAAPGIDGGKKGGKGKEGKKGKEKGSWGKKGKDKGGKQPQKNSYDQTPRPCWFHLAHHYGVIQRPCKYEADCPAAHSPILTKAQFDALQPPARSQSPAPRKGAWAKGKGDKGGKKGKGKGDKGGGKANRAIQYCNFFFNSGTCKYGDNCRNPHIPKEEVNRMKAAKAAAKNPQ